ncbi:sensor histidine kinase [Peredibacter starrii]|uniref:histidine kinase n=1 Tax=Peredibacter starrii TaxID=28202 RepID=A0AAX4HV11_9BACT|nr:GAF domain-containing sensor histidine kinase [Peredibacter starrii]WPU67228.1 GAF domain-containing sensor histidine kinase [Peredibacter starrii]
MQFFDPYHISEKTLEEDIQKFDKLLEEMKRFVKVKSELGRIFASIHHKLNKGEYSEYILDSLFKSLDSVIPFDRIGVAILEEEGDALRIIWVKSKSKIKFLHQNYSIRVEDDLLIQQILAKNSPVIINDLEKLCVSYPQSATLNLAIKEGLKSSLICPSVVENQNIGLLFFSSNSTGTYIESHVQLFQEVAEGISLIVFHGQMKKALARSSSVEKLFKNIIHDLNNPLTVIRGYLSLLEKGERYQQLGKNSKHVYSILKRNTDSMMKTIEELVYLKKEVRQLTLTSNDIDRFLEEVEDDSISMARRKDIGFTLERDENLPRHGIFDMALIKLAILNYVSNAIKFSNPHSQIEMKVRMDWARKRLYLTVKDEGLGVPESEIQNLFTEHGKTSTKPTAGEESSGRGLANVKEVVEAHKGKVFVESHVGVGSTFGFWIPCEDSFTH